MDLLVLAKRVKRGAQLLDRKFPQWRRVMRKHEHDFDIEDGECCILGTLEHKLGKLRVLAEKNATSSNNAYERALKVLKLNRGNADAEHGFDVSTERDLWGNVNSNNDQYAQLSDLWRAEFESLD